jgi:titin
MKKVTFFTGAQQKVTAPAVAGQLKSADAPEGTSLTLECYLSGTPYPTVTWYKDGVALADGPDYAITVGNNSGEPCTLRIRRLNREVHSGVYSVKAVNPGGEASSSATVTVICKYLSCANILIIFI